MSKGPKPKTAKNSRKRVARPLPLLDLLPTSELSSAAMVEFLT